MATVSVRYITEDVDAAVDFQVGRLGFDIDMRPHGGSQISLEDPSGNQIGASRPPPDRRSSFQPRP